MIVSDVHNLGAGYVACDPREQSEVVIPCRTDGSTWGVLDLDSYPIIAKQFDALPDEVHIVEIDAVDMEAGLEPSPEVEALLAEIRGAVRSLATA